jgi:hypothetical protein
MQVAHPITHAKMMTNTDHLMCNRFEVNLPLCVFNMVAIAELFEDLISQSRAERKGLSSVLALDIYGIISGGAPIPLQFVAALPICQVL